MTRALVTGAAGQDGRLLVELLLAEGTEVHALTRRPAPMPPSVTAHVGDVADLEAIRSLVVDVEPDEIYNLAAVSSVARTWADPVHAAQVNGIAAAALMDAAVTAQERTGTAIRFVQASSAEMFGVPERSPLDEHSPLRPVSPYGVAKAFAHHTVGISRRRGLHAVGAILFNHESPERPDHFVTRKITKAVAAIAAGHGERLRLGDVTAVRDWGWAADHVRGLVLAARSETAEDFVLATGVGHTVAELVDRAFACVGIEDWRPWVETEPALLRPADSPSLVGDPSRAAAVLGWRPTVDFAELVGRMVAADLAEASR